MPPEAEVLRQVDVYARKVKRWRAPDTKSADKSDDLPLCGLVGASLTAFPPC
jgi:hypothetical protein